ncbi:unnamed protein product [Caenorhabditis auriculariae]|uniref:SAND domain-containing protein n=1 Tax=Caenorhabditis auriculariae TaxID=2777116 RepID=A0A8S1GZ89_9PELO|nr:unnamed protein product [Caenorhabditis auriculariae]
MTSSPHHHEKPTLQLFYQQEEEFYEEDTSRTTSPHPRSDLVIDKSSPVPILCGGLGGRLHLEHFACPGIHEPCIEFEGCPGVLISPKEFTVQGSKEKQKDWKGSIRIGRTTLRKHMEAGTIDFFEHSKRCSGKCQSRNYLNVDRDMSCSVDVPKPSPTKLHRDLLYHINASNSGLSPVDIVDPPEGLDGKPDEFKRGRGRPKGSGKNQKLRAAFEKVNKERPEGCTDFELILQCLHNDPQTFWEQMHNAGVISHFCDEIVNGAIALKRSIAMEGLTIPLSQMLSRVVFAFDLQGLVVQRVQAIEIAIAQSQQNHLEELSGTITQDLKTYINSDMLHQDISESDLQAAGDANGPNEIPNALTLMSPHMEQDNEKDFEKPFRDDTKPF